MAHEAVICVQQRLAAIRAALLSGDLGALAEQDVLLRQALRDCADRLSPEDRAILREQARANEALLQATRRGLRNALRRMAEIRAAATGFGTYDGGGRRQQIAHRPHGVDQLF